MNKQQAEQLHIEATQAAVEATNKYLQENEHWYPCGFAWVTIKPARGAFVNYLKANNIGHKGVYGGWTVYNPSQHHGQEMYAKQAGADAYAKVLEAAGINCFSESRMD